MSELQILTMSDSDAAVGSPSPWVIQSPTGSAGFQVEDDVMSESWAVLDSAPEGFNLNVGRPLDVDLKQSAFQVEHLPDFDLGASWALGLRSSSSFLGETFDPISRCTTCKTDSTVESVLVTHISPQLFSQGDDLAKSTTWTHVGNHTCKDETILRSKRRAGNSPGGRRARRGLSVPVRIRTNAAQRLQEQLTDCEGRLVKLEEVAEDELLETSKRGLELAGDLEKLSAELLEDYYRYDVPGAMEMFNQVNGMLDRLAQVLERCSSTAESRSDSD